MQDLAHRAPEFRRRLFGWHSLPGNHRSFPWRETRDPYKILVAELLLQRTNARAVAPVYEKWMRRWPTPKKVPRADSLRRLLSPLGLPSRVPFMLGILRRLRDEFQAVVPESSDELAELLGEGRAYMRNAILIFAYDKPVAAVDRTIARVIARIFLGREPDKSRPHTDPEILSIAQVILPPARPRDYHLALLDFAASVCTPKSCCLRPIMEGICLYCHRRSAKQNHAFSRQGA